MKRTAALILTVIAALGVLAASASAATGPEVFSFGAKRGEYFDQGGGKVRLRFYGTRQATPFTVKPLHRDGRNIGPKGIAAVAKSGSVLVVELHNGRPEADSVSVRVAAVRAHHGQLIVTGKRVSSGRVRGTLDNTDVRLPKMMRGAVLTLDVNPSGPTVEGADGKQLKDASIGFIRIPLEGAAGASSIALSNFTHRPEDAGAGHAEAILWQYVEQTSFECSMYESEPNPMSVQVLSSLEGHNAEGGEVGTIAGTKPTRFSGPTDGQVIQVDEKTPSGYAAHFSVSAQFASLAFGQFELVINAGEGNSEYANLEIVCQGNVEGHEPPPAPEPQPTQEQRRWAKLIGPFFEPGEFEGS